MGLGDGIEGAAGAQPGDGDLDALVVLAATDRAALGRLLRALQPHVGAAVRSRLRRGARGIDADDVEQEVVVRLIESFPRFVPPESGQFAALVRWAAGIARQTAQIHIDRARANRATDADVLDALEDGSTDVVDEVLASERGRVVRDAITKLPEPWRDALTMRFLAHHDYGRIARELGRPTKAAARQLIRRALQALRERLERGPVPRRSWAWIRWRQGLAPPLLLSDNPIISLA